MTEIFGTLGPACAQPDILEQMFLEGMTGMRLNLSHTSLQESGPLIYQFQLAARRAGIRPELLIDMQGPEIRIGAFATPLKLKESDEVALVHEKEPDTFIHTVPVTEQVLSVLEAGDHVLLDDGRLELLVLSDRTASQKQRVMARVLQGGILCGRKSLKIKSKQITGAVMTEQDKKNIRLAKEYGVTALMQPFVTKGSQLEQVKKELRSEGMENIRIFAKIENREGMKHIQDIMPAADMIVIARGDLGNDMPLWELPAAQKMLSDRCMEEGKPFLVVTQLLASMVEHRYPTRAEVSDIYHAVLDGAAAVMVTNETAVGKYPAEVIRYLKKTVQEAEKTMAGYTIRLSSAADI